MGEMMHGGLAEKCLAGADQLLAVPRKVTFEQAASLPVAGLSSPRSVSVCYRKDACISPAARRFIEILKSTAMDIAPEWSCVARLAAHTCEP